MAIKSAKQLAGSWPHAKPPDPEGWAASLAAVLAQYPFGLVQECCDPRTGLAREREFPPTVAAVVEWCDKRLKFHRGMVRWAAPDGEREFSDDHRKSMLERLQGLMRDIFGQAAKVSPDAAAE